MQGINGVNPGAYDAPRSAAAKTTTTTTTTGVLFVIVGAWIGKLKRPLKEMVYIKRLL